MSAIAPATSVGIMPTWVAPWAALLSALKNLKRSLRQFNGLVRRTTKGKRSCWSSSPARKSPFRTGGLSSHHALVPLLPPFPQHCRRTGGGERRENRCPGSVWGEIHLEGAPDDAALEVPPYPRTPDGSRMPG